ncbi:hypothetical protein BN77_0169 [Rhizobium mesoamericanum STM3625]|uniref:Uncharacterized protein n=1 Tax=Rhizobium mesoamericanum STM3625 TaxID=1211777 RepID=K0PXI7_9HYPH|nr:hypothetical protein BN77_0169 [Rhizobium mesoamericanum STM3625]
MKGADECSHPNLQWMEMSYTALHFMTEPDISAIRRADQMSAFQPQPRLPFFFQARMP